MKFSIYKMFLACFMVANIVGCEKTLSPKVKAPTANELLHALRINDPSIVQVKLGQCLYANLFEEEGRTAPQFDRYQCDVVIERFDPILNQNHVNAQTLLLAPPTNGTPYWVID